MNVLAFMLYSYMLMMKREYKYKGRAQHHHTAPTVCIYFHLCDDDEGCCSYSQTQNTFIGRKWLYRKCVFTLLCNKNLLLSDRTRFIFSMYRVDGTTCWFRCWVMVPFSSLYTIKYLKKWKRNPTIFLYRWLGRGSFFFVPHNNTRYVMCWAIISLPGGWFSSCLECGCI